MKSVSDTAAVSRQGGFGANSRALMMPAALIALILMMVVPVPPTLLDIFFTFNIVLGLVILIEGSAFGL